MKNLKDYLESILQIFKDGEDMLENHRKVEPILKEMASDTKVLYEIIRKNLSNPDYLKRTRHYSTLAMDIVENSDLSFVVNIFPALPDKNTDISFQSIHHHGYMLLSTVAAFGPGYKAITFSKNFEIDKKTGETKMKKEKIYTNTEGNFDFVGADTPHVVFYPESVSATYALWSKKTKQDTASIAKKIPIIYKFKNQLKTVVELLGVQKLAGIAKVENYDFYPEKGKLIAMKERINYDGSIGTNENFIQNIFHFIQKTGFNDIDFLKQIEKKSETPSFCKEIINKFINNIEIKDDFIDAYKNIHKVNLLFKEVCEVTY